MESTGKIGERDPLGTKRAGPDDLGLGQLRVGREVAAEGSAASLAGTILVVRPPCAEEEMVGTDTPGIVAVMADDLPRGHGASVVQLPRIPVREHAGAADPTVSAVREPMPSPFPAAAVLRDRLPERLLEGLVGSGAHLRQRPAALSLSKVASAEPVCPPGPSASGESAWRLHRRRAYHCDRVQPQRPR